jgi:hypothetical protein
MRYNEQLRSNAAIGREEFRHGFVKSFGECQAAAYHHLLRRDLQLNGFDRFRLCLRDVIT